MSKYVFDHFIMESIKFRSKNVLNKSHNKLYGLTLCAIVFNMIFNDYLISVPHTYR
jgi:hypothetical protein